GAGGGKSLFGCYWQIKKRLKYPGSRGLIGRSKLKNLKDTTLKSFFEVSKMQGLVAGKHFVYNSQDSNIKFYNGSEIFLKDLFLYPSDPEFDSLGSLEITDAFIDEANQVTKKAKDMVKSRIRFMLDENNLLPKLLMSCNPAKNWTYSDFYKAHRDGTLPMNRQFIQALLSDNPHISKHYKQNLMSLDENSKQRLLYGNWEYDNDPNSLMGYDSLVNLFSNVVSIVKPIPRGTHITVDVARFGKDKTTIFVWDGLQVIFIYEIAKSDLKVLVDKVEELRRTYKIPKNKVIVDEDGVGGGVVDFGKYKGFVNNSKALHGKNYVNLKSQCSYKLAEVINKGDIGITPQQYRDVIIEELEQIKSYKTDSDAKLKIMPKEMVKQFLGRSPDYSDNMMMRMWFEIGHKKANYVIL
ncbi:MAG: phage terminase large subunit, partial [Nanoarchaeota archaeon]|nr:phage terminase large subunit [Nanoarchaeota archaeon]